MKELLFFYGNPPDYPDNIDWLIKDFVKNLNRVLAEINISISGLIFDNSKFDSLSYKLNFEGLSKKIYIKYTEYSSYEDVLKIIIHEINKNIKSDQVILEKPTGDNESYNNANYFIKLFSGTNIREFKDFLVKNKTNIYPADFYLPIDSENDLINTFFVIANLNPKNKLSFEIVEQSDENFVIKCILNEKEEEYSFDIRGFDRIGNMLNNFVKTDQRKYVLIEPDDDTLVYAFCSQKVIDLLSKHQFLRNPAH
jgi:hypothetical protein